MADEIEAEILTSIETNCKVTYAATCQKITTPTTSEPSDVTLSLKNPILLDNDNFESCDGLDGASLLQMHCGACNTSENNSSSSNVYEDMQVKLEPLDYQHPVLNSDLKLYTELRNDVWNDIFPTDSKVTKDDRKHLGINFDQLEETNDSGLELSDKSSDPLSDGKKHGEHLSKQLPNDTLNHSTVHEHDSYETLNSDVWNEIFPVHNLTATLCNNDCNRDVAHLPYSTLQHEDIKKDYPNYTSINRVQFKESEANKDIECESPTKKKKLEFGIDDNNFSSDDPDDVDITNNMPSEMIQNPVYKTVPHLEEDVNILDTNHGHSLSRSMITSIDDTFDKQCVGNEYDSIDEYDSIQMDNQEVKYISERRKSNKEMRNTLPVVPPREARIMNGVKSNALKASRRKCLCIGGIVLLVVVSIVVIAVVLNNHFNVEENLKTLSLETLNAQKFLTDLPLGYLSMISKSEPIEGLTVLDSQLFVIRLGSSQVNVYNTNNLTLTRNITITGSTNLQAIVASPQYNCLYIRDDAKNVIYRYNLFHSVITSWSVGGFCRGLSVTSTHNVLVTLWVTQQIKEYTPNGSLVREISLESSITWPHHSVQLSSDLFVVSHGGRSASVHRVCIVDTSGRVIQCYGGSKGPGIGQLNEPTKLAVDSHDNVLVTDSNNNRIVLLSPLLTHFGEITEYDYSLSHPYALHLDLITRRLYIGELSSGRVFVLTAAGADRPINGIQYRTAMRLRTTSEMGNN